MCFYMRTCYNEIIVVGYTLFEKSNTINGNLNSFKSMSSEIINLPLRQSELVHQCEYHIALLNTNVAHRNHDL